MFRIPFFAVRPRPWPSPSRRLCLETLEDRLTPSSVIPSNNYVYVFGSNDKVVVKGSGDVVTVFTSGKTVTVNGNNTTVVVLANNLTVIHGSASVSVSS